MSDKRSTNESEEHDPRKKSLGVKPKLLFVAAFAGAVVLFFLIYNQYLTPEKITAAESAIRESYSRNPILFLLIAFLIYVVATGLSLPISTALSLSYAWILGWVAVPLLNLAATCGATLAFLSARFLLRDWVQKKFQTKLKPIYDGFERDGAFYILSMRMIAIFPFFVLNLVLGLVPVKTRTFFWATMVGMLPLNFAFVYLGMQIPSTQEFLDGGVKSLISWPIILGIGLIGLVPLVLRVIINRLSKNEDDASTTKGSGS